MSLSRPDAAQRLAACERPASAPVMYQQWRDLLFLHWEYSADRIQETLPDGLWVDTFDRKAYLGVVPFFMRNIRPRFLPPLPGVSNFLELNLRTYVHDRAGVPGVWFYSLDANQALAVKIARGLFHLPYKHAAMKATREPDNAVRYESTRRTVEGPAKACRFEYAPETDLPSARPGSLEFFLIERYRLYAADGDRLWRGAVFHDPYPLCRAKVTAWDEELLNLNGFSPTRREPDHVVMSRGVNVNVYPLRKLRGTRIRSGKSRMKDQRGAILACI